MKGDCSVVEIWIEVGQLSSVIIPQTRNWRSLSLNGGRGKRCEMRQQDSWEKYLNPQSWSWEVSECRQIGEEKENGRATWLTGERRERGMWREGQMWVYGDVIARSFYERVLEPSNSRARYTHSLRARVTHDSYALIRCAIKTRIYARVTCKDF